jgi:hypothetical protein
VTEQERLAAALEYQQAQQPARMNPNLAAQGEKSRNRLATALASPSWSGEELPMENRATFLPFRDTMPGSVMNKRELALPGIVAGAVNAITAPARSMETYTDDYGEVRSKFNAPQEAANVALNMMGGGMSASRGAPANALGMFVGPRSKGWNAEANARAVQMEKAGATPEAIWQETGNYKAPDAAWRQEINDAGSRMTEKVHSDIMSKHFYNDPLSEALTHEPLYQAYPELGKINTTVTAMEQPKGSFSPLRNELEASGPSSMTQRSTALHEIQHAIQQKEGFARGGSPEMFPTNPHINDAQIIATLLNKGKLPSEAIKWVQENLGRRPSPQAIDLAMNKNIDLSNMPSALDQYRRLAGEAEARATQKRRNLTDEQRRAEFPERSYDVPINELIIRR